MSNDFRPTPVTLWTMPKTWLRFVLKPFVLRTLFKPMCWAGRHVRSEWWTFPNGMRDRSIRLCVVRCKHCLKRL